MKVIIEFKSKNKIYTTILYEYGEITPEQQHNVKFTCSLLSSLGFNYAVKAKENNLLKSADLPYWYLYFQKIDKVKTTHKWDFATNEKIDIHEKIRPTKIYIENSKYEYPF